MFRGCKNSTMTIASAAKFFLFLIATFLTVVVVVVVTGLKIESKNNFASRRQIFQTVNAAVGFGLATGFGSNNNNNNNIAKATDENDELIDVYFGCGCFWHVQHEFVQAERRILNRNDDTITARAGYAGGLSKDSTVCYHNALNVGDYGKLGHAEVVALQIPTLSFGSFVQEYCNLFDKQGLRPDQFGDRGPEYRNLVGIPGGTNNIALSKILVETSIANGDKLDFGKGKGNDPDLKAVSFIMDSTQFPFYIAEQYHQFHDGFNFGENYPNSYNNLASTLAKSGQLEKSMCPNGALGIGVGGL